MGNHEWKVAIYDAGTLGMTSVGTSCVTADLGATIAVGADYTRNRLGRRVRAHQVILDGMIYGAQTNSVADDATNVVRVTLSVGRYGFTPAWTVFSPLDVRSNVGLVSVIYDEKFIINTNAKDSTGYILKAVRLGVRPKFSQLLDWTGTAAAAPSDRSVFLTVVSDSSAVVNPGLSSNTYITLIYEDAN